MSPAHTRPNGALFFDELEGYLVTLHDLGVVNENALLERFRELRNGAPLTRDMLAHIFGVEVIHDLMAPRRP